MRPFRPPIISNATIIAIRHLSITEDEKGSIDEPPARGSSVAYNFKVDLRQQIYSSNSSFGAKIYMFVDIHDYWAFLRGGEFSAPARVSAS